MKIIAESAFNHNGDLDYLIELANKSKETGADFFTVQVMDPDAFCVSDYSRYDIYQENSFSPDEWKLLFDHCKKIDLNLIPNVLDEPSFDLCYNEGFRFIKVHATDINNGPFLRKINEKEDIRILLETQVATYQDISFALNIIGTKVECLMHGFSNYPTEVEDLRLNALDAIKTDFPGFALGLADHSHDIVEVPLIALGKGVEYLEKHITLTRNNRNFDWQVSLYPYQFSAMVSTIRHYEKSLGLAVKHPTDNEKSFRNVLYKKVTKSAILQRMDGGEDFLTYEINRFSRDKIGVALIARLKSQRLKKKVLKKFNNQTLIEDLYSRLNESKLLTGVSLATSNLEEDAYLVELFQKNDWNVFVGHPVSVIDRILSLAIENKWGGVFRVTGDNPFTDPVIIDEMVKLFVENDLDYVRANNVPFGVSAELFSVKYLWELYMKMENPLNSEYLSWFVVHDKEANKGSVDLKINDDKIPFVNLSVDYQQDYDRTISLLERIKKPNFKTVELNDIIDNLDLTDIEPSDKIVKLPEGESILFSEYLELLNNIDYKIRKTI